MENDPVWTPPYRGFKITFKITYSYSKVTYSYSNVTYSDFKIAVGWWVVMGGWQNLV